MDRNLGKDTAFNLKHFNTTQRRNKQEYKKKSKMRSSAGSKLLKNEKKSMEIETIPNLPTNWSKYEEEENETKNEDKMIKTAERGVNYETLTNEPLSQAIHFKFKSEHEWDHEINTNLEQIELCKYFMLDLKLLGKGISSVPFNKRHNYPQELFSKTNLDTQEKKANEHLKTYRNYLIKQKTNTVRELTNTNKIREEKNEKTQMDVNDVVNDLLNLNISQLININDVSIDKVDISEEPFMEATMNVNKITKSVDLEQWLDDVLDN